MATSAMKAGDFLSSSCRHEELHGVSAGGTLGSPSEDTLLIFAAFQLGLSEFL